MIEVIVVVVYVRRCGCLNRVRVCRSDREDFIKSLVSVCVCVFVGINGITSRGGVHPASVGRRVRLETPCLHGAAA